MSNIQAAFVVDGKVFASKAEALEYIRLPKVTAALNALTSNNADLTKWLLAHQDTVEAAFDTGTIRRVTKSDAKKLAAACAHLATLTDPKLSFLIDNVGAVQDSFRWPAVKRMTDEEKATAARNTLTAASDNEELAVWVLANKEGILAAYEAGVEKKAAPVGGQNALAEWRAKQAAEKAAKAAAAAA